MIIVIKGRGFINQGSTLTLNPKLKDIIKSLYRTCRKVAMTRKGFVDALSSLCISRVSRVRGLGLRFF